MHIVQITIRALTFALTGKLIRTVRFTRFSEKFDPVSFLTSETVRQIIQVKKRMKNSREITADLLICRDAEGA